MAALTKGAVRTAFWAAIADDDGDAWPTSAADQLLSLVGDVLFTVLLTNWPWLTSTSETETPVASAIALSGLTTKRFFAVQKVLSGSTEYKPAVYGQTFAAPYYYVLGGSIVTAAPGVGTTNTDVTYSYLPTRFTDLATDNTALDDWLPGSESALIYLAAAWAMTRGDEESMAQIARIADYNVDALLRWIAHRYPSPVQPNLQAIKQQIMGAVLSAPLPQAS